MGIFSLFAKKETPPSSTTSRSIRKKREVESADTLISTHTVTLPNTDTGRDQIGQRKAAQATAMKIDAIESEMSSEFVKPLNGASSRQGNQPVAKANSSESSAAEPSFQATLPMMDSATGFLLGAETFQGENQPALSASEEAAAIEEAAILFANGQLDMVEHLLQNALLEPTSEANARVLWGMLFDFYQMSGRELDFNNLSIEYASKFETSPPAWIVPLSAAPIVKRSSATPTVPFSGKLNSGIVKLLERTQNLAEKSRVLRLEFVRVTEVDPIGCGLLLNILKKLQKSGHELILVGAPELAIKIRSILEVGRRDETEAPWLLLLEILALLNLEKDFEDASIEYCITFEVSPPAFVATKTRVTTAPEEAPSNDDDLGERFVMPALIEGRADELISAITAYSAEHNPAYIDCLRLNRVDFAAAGQLLSGLAPLAANDVQLELHNVNHLVAELFNIIGLKDVVRVIPRRI